MPTRYATSPSENGARLSEQFSRLVQRWQPAFNRLAQGQLRDTNLGSAFCVDLIRVLTTLSEPYGCRPSEALADLTLPILARLNYDLFGEFESWELQNFVADGEFDLLPAGAPWTCVLFAGKGEKEAADECAFAFLELFSAFSGHERSADERQVLESFVTAITLLTQVEDPSDQRRVDCALLEVPEQHDSDGLRSAYKKKVQAWHPDRLEGMAPELRSMATEQMSEINAAYERLKRADYSVETQVLREDDGSVDDVGRTHNLRKPADFGTGSDAVVSGKAASPRTDSPGHMIGITFALLVVVLALASVFLDFREKREPSVSTAKNDEQPSVSTHGPKPSPSDVTAATRSGQEARATSPVDEDTRSQVMNVLQNWASSMVTNDVDQILPFYADHLDRYFLQRNVDRSAVRASKESWLATGNRVTAFSTLNPVMEMGSDGEIRVHLYKQVSDVDANSTPVSSALLIRSELRLINLSGQWQIVSERDFR